MPTKAPPHRPNKSGSDKYPPGLHKALTHLKRGGLHKALGVPLDKDIPAEKLRKAQTSKNSHIRHMAAFAETLDHFQK